ILLGDRHRRCRRIDLFAQHGARQSTAGPAPVVGAGLLAMFEGAVVHPAGLGLPEVFAFVLPRERAIAPERTSVKPGLRQHRRHVGWLGIRRQALGVLALDHAEPAEYALFAVIAAVVVGVGADQPGLT